MLIYKLYLNDLKVFVLGCTQMPNSHWNIDVGIGHILGAIVLFVIFIHSCHAHWIFKGVMDWNSLVHEASCCRPGLFGRLQRHKTCKVKAIQIDWVSIGSSGIWLSQDCKEEPARANYTGHSKIGSVREVQEGGTPLVNLSHLSGWIVCEVLTGQLVDDVIKLELRDHEHTCRLCHVFHLFSLRYSFANCSRRTLSAQGALFFPIKCELVGDPSVDWQASNWDFLLG